jgi:hypothetical protein
MNAAIERCRREQEAALACTDDPAWLVTLGWCDWQWEAELLEAAAEGVS